MRTTVKRLLAPLMVLAAAACDETPVSLPEATTVAFTTADLRLVAGDVAPIQARVLDQEGRPIEGVSPTFTSDAPGVAYVDASGLVHAVTPGTANITAAYGGASAQTRVTVTRNEREFVQSLDLLADSLVVDTRMGVQPVAVRAFNGAGQQVCPALTVRSSDASVATAAAVAAVAAAGGCRVEVTPVFPGETTVTVTADGVSDAVRVRVTNDVMTAFLSARPAASSIFAGNTVSYTVRVIDEAGNGIAGRVVNLDVSAGTLSASRITTGADGTASVQWTLPTRLSEVGRFQTFRVRAQLPNGSVVARTEEVTIDTGPLVRLTVFGRNINTGTLSTLNPGQPISVRFFESFNFAAEGEDQFGNQAAPSLVFSTTGSLSLCGSNLISESLRAGCVFTFSGGSGRLTVSGRGLSRSFDIVTGNN